MNKQFTLLDWIYDHKNIFPLKSGKIFQAYSGGRRMCFMNLEVENYAV